MATKTPRKPPKAGKPADNPRSRIGDRMRSPEHIEAALRASGGVISIAAQKLGCHRQRLYEWINESPILSQLLKDIRNELLDLAEAKLLEHISAGSEKSIHFYLKTQGRDRGYSEKVLLGGAPGEPVETKVVEIFQLPDNGRG